MLFANSVFFFNSGTSSVKQIRFRCQALCSKNKPDLSVYRIAYLTECIAHHFKTDNQKSPIWMPMRTLTLTTRRQHLLQLFLNFRSGGLTRFKCQANNVVKGNFSNSSAKQEGPEALNPSPEYTGQNQTFNFKI